MRDDRELLRSYIEERSNDAFAELVNRYVDLVYSAALRKLNGDTHKAQDIAQAVFIKLATHCPTLPDDRILAGWLYTTAHNTASKAIRSEVRRRQREQEAQTMHEITAGEDVPLDWQQVRPLLDDAMHELDGRDRDAILLRFFERRPFAEIGDQLGLSENAARMRVERALDKLHGLLTSRGIHSTGAAFGVLLTSEAIVAAPPSLASGIVAAAASAATAGTTLTTFTLMTTMTTAKLAALVSITGLSIAANLMLVTRLQDRDLTQYPILQSAFFNATTAAVKETSVRASDARTARAARVSTPPGLSAVSKSVPTTFDLLHSNDPAVFAANLLAAGFPRPAVLGAVTRLLRDIEDAQRDAILRTVPNLPFWKTTEVAEITGEQWAALSRFRAQRATTNGSLFPEQNELQVLKLRPQYGQLSDEKLLKINNIVQDYSQMMQKFTSRGVMPWDADGIALLQKEQQADIAAVLTPAELEEYNFRNSPTGQSLRQVAGFDFSEQEFRELYRIREPFEAKLQVPVGTQVTTAEERQAQTQAQQELNAQIKAALGDTRYADYARGLDPGFQQTYTLAKQLNLPTESATAAYQIQQETVRLATQIRADPTVPAEQKTGQLQQLAQEATQRLTPLLTPAGIDLYKARGSGSWLRNLTAPTPRGGGRP